jgi:RimJ/RimL family protein N-acetyltransferase
VRLEPMSMDHLPELAAIAFDREIRRWMPMQGSTEAELRLWMTHALDAAAAGQVLPWVIRSTATGAVAGSTRYMDIRTRDRGLEIGATWLAPAWQRSGMNVEAKYLQMRHAFEELCAVRVCFKTHHQNRQSQTAIAALGATREGVFRNHVIMPDGSLRHSVWYSIVAEEWPQIKARLEARMARASNS